MNRAFFASLVLALGGCQSASPPDLTHPDTALPSFSRELPAGVILLGPAGRSALHQCSRPVPDVDEEHWEPGLRALREADALLEALSASWQSCRPPRPFAGYVRQYLGVLVRGRNLLYVNAAAYDSKPPHTAYSDPVVYCDGGAQFCGALIDPDAGRVLSIQVNGPLGPGYECTPSP